MQATLFVIVSFTICVVSQARNEVISQQLLFLITSGRVFTFFIQFLSVLCLVSQAVRKQYIVHIVSFYSIQKPSGNVSSIWFICWFYLNGWHSGKKFTLKPLFQLFTVEANHLICYSALHNHKNQYISKNQFKNNKNVKTLKSMCQGVIFLWYAQN